MPDLVYCHIYLYIFVQDRYYGICIYMYDSACEQGKLHDAGREAGATQIVNVSKCRWNWRRHVLTKEITEAE